MKNSIIKHLPFEGIKDLLHKVELIRKAHLLEKEKYTSELIKNNIPFQDISSYGVAVNLDDLTDQQIAIAMNNHTSITKEMYDSLGVTETVINLLTKKCTKKVI